MGEPERRRRRLRPPHTPNPQTPDPHTPNPHTPDPHTSNPHIPNPHTPNPHTSNPQTPNPQTPNPQTADPAPAAGPVLNPPAPPVSALPAPTPPAAGLPDPDSPDLDSQAQTPPIADPVEEPATKPRAVGFAGRPRPVPGDDRESERGLRGLVGSGSSQVSVGAALRARDAARPTEAHLAEAEQTLAIVRRNWTPRESLPRNR
jgi:hypothetical protein